MREGACGKRTAATPTPRPQAYLTDRTPATRTSAPATTPPAYDKDRKTRNHIRQLEALGYTVTLTQAA